MAIGREGVRTAVPTRPVAPVIAMRMAQAFAPLASRDAAAARHETMMWSTWDNATDARCWGPCSRPTVPCVAQKSPSNETSSRPSRTRPALAAHLKAASRGVRSGELAFLCLAGLHDGISPSDRVLSAALSRLAKASRIRPMTSRCGCSCSRRAPRSPVAETSPARPQGPVDAPVARRRVPIRPAPEHVGLGNTQHGALGLRAASSMGLKISEVWSKLARTIGANQTKSGGYGPTCSGDDSYASMTVAGIAVSRSASRRWERAASRRSDRRAAGPRVGVDGRPPGGDRVGQERSSYFSTTASSAPRSL